ncbi:MAG: ABC transporter permease [Candidatus Omnitrophota bacterium]
MKHETYEPNRYLKMGIKIWPCMIKDLARARELLWRFFIRDWSAKYRQSVLGYLWAVIMPFIAIGTFVFLNRAGILNIAATGVPYPLFALTGLTVWQLFSTGITSGCNSIVAAGSMVSKINFPLEVLVFSSVAQAIFEFFIKCFMIIIAFFVFRYIPPWTVIFFPLAVLPVLILTLGCSFILSLVNGILRDTANAVSLVTMFLMFLCPVLYPAPVSGNKALFFRLNPISPLIAAPRDLIVYGYIKEPVDFFISTIISVLFFLISWRIFYLVKSKIPERV